MVRKPEPQMLEVKEGLCPGAQARNQGAPPAPYSFDTSGLRGGIVTHAAALMLSWCSHRNKQGQPQLCRDSRAGPLDLGVGVVHCLVSGSNCFAL